MVCISGLGSPRSALVVAPREECAVTLSAIPGRALPPGKKSTGLSSVSTVIAAIPDTQKGEVERLFGF